jgi:phosphoglycerate dehydrogenase-like enzyme
MNALPGPPADRPVVAVLHEDDLPPGLTEDVAAAELRFARADELPDALAGAHVLLVWDFLSSAVEDAWPAADRLQWVHAASAGVDRLMFPALVDSDVLVTNSRGVFERPIAEYVLGLLLAFAKDLPRSWDLQRERSWLHRETETLAGTHAVVVGTGPIGRETGHLLRAVGMAVTLVGRTERHDPEFGVVCATEDLPALVAEADFVVAAVPLTPQTTGLFDRRLFRAMRRTARFVNVGRGPSVVERDLLDALEAGEIAGAALDVFEEEPLPPGHPLWSATRLFVSPHMSGDAGGWREALVRLFLDNLDRWRRGDPLRNVVDKQRGYVPGG